MKNNKSNIVSLSSQRLKELQENNRISSSPTSPSIDEMVVIKKSKSRDKRNLIETSEIKNSNGYKFLKVWELYSPDYSNDTQWEYTKNGILIPITDAKKWIKRLYQHYYPSSKNPSK